MAAKDRYTKGIECPQCQAKGVLHLSENDYPFMRKLGRTLDAIDGAFTAELEDEVKVVLKCGSCGCSTTLKI